MIARFAIVWHPIALYGFCEALLPTLYTLDILDMCISIHRYPFASFQMVARVNESALSHW